MTVRHAKPRTRTDWFRVLTDLQRAGHSHARVGKILGIPLGTIVHWKQGGEPSHAYGHRLLELWMEVTGLAMGERPMTFD